MRLRRSTPSPVSASILVVQKLGILGVVIFSSSCSLLFDEATPGAGTPALDGGILALDGGRLVIDGGVVAIDGARTPSDAMVTDASTTAQIVPTGQTTASIALGDVVGNPFAISCPNSGVIYGIQASTNSTDGRLCAMHILCATLRNARDDVQRVENPSPIPVKGFGDCLDNLEPSATTICPDNSVATGIILGRYMAEAPVYYQVGLACSAINSKAMATMTFNSPPIGSIPPMHPSPLALLSVCATQKVATGLTGYANNAINQVSLPCRALEIQSTN